MGKKLSMMVLGVAVMGFCMAAVPEGKAEAANVTNQITCEIGGSGYTGAHANTTSFRDYGRGVVRVFMGWVSTGKNRFIWARQNSPYSKYHSIVRNVPSYTYTFELYVKR